MNDLPAAQSGATARADDTLGMRRPVSTLVVFGVLIVVVIIVYLFLLSVFRGTNFTFVPALILAAGAFATNLAFLRLDKMSLASIGLERLSPAVGKFFLGLSLGTLLVGGWLFIVFLFLAPEFKLHSPDILAASANLILFYFFNNAGEELAYRAYAFIRLEHTYGRPMAIMTTSAIFALLHIQGGMAWTNALAGVFTSGLVFGVLFAYSKSLPLTLGFHCATNVGQDVFGLRQTPLSFITLDYLQPVASGATAALLAVAALNLIVFFAVIRFYKGHGHPIRREKLPSLS